MTRAYEEFTSFYLQYTRATEQRAKKRVLAENAWLVTLIQQRFPAFLAGSDSDLNCLREILPIIGALRPFRLDDENNDLDTIAEHRPGFQVLMQFVLLSGQDLGAFCSRLDEVNIQETDGIAVCADDDDVGYCEHLGQYVIDGDIEEVRVSSHHVEAWCSRARDVDAFYCDISDTWYSHTYYTAAETVSESTICAEVANSYGYYRCNDGYYSNDSDDYEDEDEDDGIPAYHDAYRNWNYAVSNAATRGFYGFEIEIDFPTSRARSDCWNEVFSGTCFDYTAEHDGSLDEDTGLEVITRPFSMHELRSDKSILKNLIHRLVTGFGAEEGHDGYGVHVTTNLGRLPLDHQERFRRFIVDNQRFSEYVARRPGTEYCHYLWDWGDKHSAVASRGDTAAEVRIFKSSLNYAVLMSYAEYIEAVIDWTRDPQHMLKGPLATSLFRHWVCLTGQYPHLAARFPRQTAKEIHTCVLPSSSRPVEFSRKKSSNSASRTTRTAAVLPTELPTTTELTESSFVAGFSTSTSSIWTI